MNRSLFSSSLPPPTVVGDNSTVTTDGCGEHSGDIADLTGIFPYFHDAALPVHDLYQTLTQKLHEIKEVMLVFEERLTQVESRSTSMKLSDLHSLTRALKTSEPNSDQLELRFNSMVEGIKTLGKHVESQGRSIKALQSAQQSLAKRDSQASLLPKENSHAQPTPSESDTGVVSTSEGSPISGHGDLIPHVRKQSSQISLMHERLESMENALGELHSDHKEVKKHVEISKNGEQVHNAFVTTLSLQTRLSAMKGDIMLEARSLVQYFRMTGDGQPGNQVVLVEYRFKESIWDLTMLNGMVKCRTNVVVTAMLAVLNTAVVLVFCVVISVNFLEHPFGLDALEGLKDFRSTFAHDEKYAHLYSGGTLASQICRAQSFEYGLNYLMYGNAQLATLQTIYDYIGHDWLTSMFGGPTMCMLALYFWTLTVSKEFVEVHSFVTACWMIPFGKHTHIEHWDGQFHLKEWARWRRWLLLGIVALRTACCLSLICGGGIWLSLTTDVESLILNAVALDFVLNIDELLYESAAPRKSRAFLTSIAPLNLPQRQFLGGIDQFSLGVLVLAPVVTLLFFFLEVMPLLSTMREAQELLCGYNLDLMFALDSSGMVWFDRISAGQQPSPERLAVVDMTKKAKFSEITGDGNTYGIFITPADPGFIHSLASRPKEQLIDNINFRCEDFLDFGPDMYTFQKFLSANLGHTVTSCAHAKNFGACETFNGRYLCPETCQCDKPDSPVPTSSGPTSGCPAACLASKAYLHRLKQLECTDMSVAYLQNSSFWQAWADYTDSAFLDVPGVSKAMRATGCGFLNMTQLSRSKYLMCQGRDIHHTFRPLAPICPSTCRCSENTLIEEACAPQCRPR